MKNKKAFSLIELSVAILIIVILVAGVSSSSRVLRQMRLSSARTQTQSSPVAGIKDLYAWWETTSEKSFNNSDTENGDSVSNWYDLNPQLAYNIGVTQGGSATLKPTYYSDGINGLPALNFDGGDYLKTSIDQPAIFSSGAGSTVFTVFQATDVATQRFLVMQPLGNCTRNIEIGHTTGANASGNYGINSGCGYATVAPEGTVTSLRPVIMSLVMFASPLTSGSTANTAIFKNGGATLALTADTVGGYNNSLSKSYGTGVAPLFIGARDSLNNGTVNANFVGKIGEIIIFNRALSAEERREVEKYLGKKWEISVS